MLFAENGHELERLTVQRFLAVGLFVRGRPGLRFLASFKSAELNAATLP
jgi:hypothetical protein